MVWKLWGELPKFTPQTYNEKRMQVLWLRFLTEINEHTVEVPQELQENPEIGKAVQQLRESAFSEEQLRGYEKFWDMVSTAKMHLSSSRREGLEEGLEKGREEERLKNARGMKAAGIPSDVIVKITGLSQEEVEVL